MKTASEKLSPTRVKLTVEVPFDELKPAVEAATKKIADQVQIPGFRKGKVPTRLVEQRFGRPAIMQEAVNDSLPDFYQKAAAEVELKPVGRPEVEITEVPGLDGSEDGDLVFVVEQDVRPEIELPNFSEVEVEIEEPAVDDDAVEVRLTELRERFGTLVGVDRPAENGDFVSLDMLATIDDEEIESVEGVSYQIGQGNMLEGLDEALEGLSAGETTTFTSELAGGEHAGQEALIKVTPQSVKVRELPEADDEFAEMASEFDTIDELKDDLRTQAAADAEGNRVALARNALLEKLLEDIEIPVPDQLVEDEVKGHLENEGKEEGDPHGEEIREDTVKAIRAQFLLDEINATREVQVGQEDLMAYMQQMSAQYGIEPNQLLQMLAQSGQLEQIFGEVQRSKALDVALAEVTVKNDKGEVLDLGLKVNEDSDDESAADKATESADQNASDKAEAAEKDDAEAVSSKKAEASEKSEAAEGTKDDAPAKKAPAKKPAAKKAPAKKTAAKKADEAETAKSSESTEDTSAKKAPAKKAPAKKPAAKKAPAKKAEASADAKSGSEESSSDK